MFKCKEGGHIRVSAKRNNKQIASLNLDNNYHLDAAGTRKRHPKYGDLLFSTDQNVRHAKVTGEYMNYEGHRRRRLLAEGRAGQS